MREEFDGKNIVVEFNSMQEFYQYLCDTPLNEVFRWATKDSQTESDRQTRWTGTQTFDEAVDLFKHGWSEMSEKLVQRLKVDKDQMEPVMTSKNVIGVQGYQPVVPLYLMGLPNAMVRKEMQPAKQKVITFNKSIDYDGGQSADTIIEESIKALKVIQALEAQNYRCNLNLVLGSITWTRSLYVKIRLKSANERLNISKLSFPLVHPSMLRRLLLRLIEVHPLVTNDFIGGYGRPATDNQLRVVFKGEYLLPAFIRKDLSKIKRIKHLKVLEDLDRM